MNRHLKRTIIVGAGIAGRDVLREIKKSPELKILPVGFIDDNFGKWNKLVDGLKIFGGRELIKTLVVDQHIEEVIIAIPSAHGEQISDIVRICSESRVGFRIVPRVKEIIEGKAHLENVREVRVEDLLGRPVIKSDVRNLRDFFHQAMVLVTGAAGSIGSELSRQIAAYKPKKLILFDWWENGLYQLQREFERSFPTAEIEYCIGNVQNEQKVEWTMKRFRPDYVFHAAAYKHVPLMEENPSEAVKNNVFGTLNVAKLAKENNVKLFVFVSTDKAATPVSVMGVTKLIGEGIVKELNSETKFITVRFGNVLDSYGSVIPIFRRQIEMGGPVTVTDPRMTRFFMTIPEAAQLILKAARLGKGGELFVLDMGEPVKILDLAENMIRLSGLIPNRDIKIVYTGVRKGEKLNEQLFNEKEKLASTKVDKIYKTESLGISLNGLSKALEKLREYAEDNDGENLRKEFAALVDGFPQNK